MIMILINVILQQDLMIKDIIVIHPMEKNVIHLVNKIAGSV